MGVALAISAAARMRSRRAWLFSVVGISGQRRAVHTREEPAVSRLIARCIEIVESRRSLREWEIVELRAQLSDIAAYQRGEITFLP
jgi:hypothetical protein